MAKYNLPQNTIDMLANGLQEYHYMRYCYLGHTKSCGPASISLITQCSPYALLMDLIKRGHKSANQGMLSANIMDAIRRRGYDLLYQYSGDHYTGKTLKTFTPHNDRVDYVIFVARHVATYKAGLGIVDHARGRACRILEVYRIIKREEI